MSPTPQNHKNPEGNRQSHRISEIVRLKIAAGEKPNRLLREKSPYLLQHAFNPVDWYPWGEEAFRRARDEKKIIFLSIGYSTCYWCHVMEREVFENSAIAALMNDLVVSVKVDREERPDVDRIYMTAVQAMTGSGGWPMSVFLTPDLKPFYGATYIPPAPAHGRPGFPELLKQIVALWNHEPERIGESGEKLVELLRTIGASGENPDETADLAGKAYTLFSSAYDSLNGGFGTAPKFPRPAALTFLLSYHRFTRAPSAPEEVLHTLRRMASGGIFDQLGGGFHRYSVDGEWRVPHFEKMLYDQAQLSVSYLEAFQLTGEGFFADISRRTLDYVLTEMRDPGGGFYSAEDAESVAGPGIRKEEGAFYVWTFRELLDTLGEERGNMFAYRYGVRKEGNALHDPHNVFGGKNILYVARTTEETAAAFGKPPERTAAILDECRETLGHARSLRARPHLDDKILSGWNGLMISAFSKGYQVLGESRFLDAAVSAAAFLRQRITDPSTGKIMRRYRDGEARFEGGLQDYAFTAQGLLDLYEANFDEEHLRRALSISELQLDLFRDPSGGALFDTPPGDPTLLFRSKEEYDGAEPTGNAVTAMNFFRLARMTDDGRWKEAAGEIVRSVSARIRRRPDAAPLILAVSLWTGRDPLEIVVSGSMQHRGTQLLLAEIRRRYLPFKVVMAYPPASKPESPLPPYLRDLITKADSPMVHLCREYSCLLPTGDPARLGSQLDMEIDPPADKS